MWSCLSQSNPAMEFAMSTALLVREPISVPCEFAERVAQVHSHKNRDAVTASHKPANLRQALYDLKITPFTTESVNAYKVKKRIEAEAANHRRKVTHQTASVFLFFTAAACAIVLAIGFFSPFVAGPWIIGGVLAISALCSLLVRIKNQPYRRKLDWMILCWYSYVGVVPESVRVKARLIEERYPGVYFSVERLQEDPFLVAQDETDYCYYVAAWDEEIELAC